MHAPLPHPEQLIDTVGHIYASALDGSPTEPLLHRLTEALNGSAARLHVRERHSHRVLRSTAAGREPLSSRAHREYLAHWGTSDPRPKLLTTVPCGEPVRCHERLDEQFVSRSDFFQEFLIPHGLRWGLSGVFQASSDSYTMVSVLREPDAPPFEDWTATMLRQLLPHFRRAWAIGERIEKRSQATQPTGDLFTRLPIPCLLTDRAGRCIEANERFRTITQAFAAKPVLGRLRFEQPQVQDQWERALQETHATALARRFTARTAGRQWEVHLVPWDALRGSGHGTDGRMILAMFEETGAQAHRTQAMLAEAKLTRAEQEVLTALLQGLPAKTIARERSASFNTIRNQIMRILQKTGHHSQKELIASMGTSVLPDSVLDLRSD